MLVHVGALVIESPPCTKSAWSFGLGGECVPDTEDSPVEGGSPSDTTPFRDVFDSPRNLKQISLWEKLCGG